MDEVARYALTSSVVASALGGVVLCALTLKYGLGPPEEDEFGPLAHRRVMLSRAGHAIAAVCFAATASLVVVALSRVQGDVARRELSAVENERLGQDVRAFDARLSAVEDALKRVGTAVDELAQRIDPSASLGSGPALPPRRSSGR